uniref:Uncharacterized protein n=1 Tax=Octopus bimaculoides TaxID=37653 RepID=A0A0L8FLS6_OCTBM
MDTAQTIQIEAIYYYRLGKSVAHSIILRHLVHASTVIDIYLLYSVFFSHNEKEKSEK